MQEYEKPVKQVAEGGGRGWSVLGGSGGSAPSGESCLLPLLNSSGGIGGTSPWLVEGGESVGDGRRLGWEGNADSDIAQEYKYRTGIKAMRVTCS